MSNVRFVKVYGESPEKLCKDKIYIEWVNSQFFRNCLSSETVQKFREFETIVLKKRKNPREMIQI